MVGVLLLMFAPTSSGGRASELIKSTEVKILRRSLWFLAGKPIDLAVTVKYDGGTQDGFDVGVFHKGRLVGWEMNKKFNNGPNTCKLRDNNFKGDPGAYIVKLRYKGKIFKSRFQ